ncbi:MAG: hypothetical protein NVSMB64_13720 [Candidatus Velthaea sp.]
MYWPEPIPVIAKCPLASVFTEVRVGPLALTVTPDIGNPVDASTTLPAIELAALVAALSPVVCASA